MRSGILFIVLMGWISASLFGQDIHFTQFGQSPILASPSMAGPKEADYRAGVHYRNQWPWGSTDRRFVHRTMAGFADFSFTRYGIPQRNRWGLGLQVVNDQAGDGRLHTLQIMLAASYQRTLGRMKKWHWGMGIQVAFVQKQLQWNRLFFDNQWDDGTFNTNLPTGEAGDQNRMAYPDMGIGTHLTYQTKQKGWLTTAIRVTHINRPQESFLMGDNRLGLRPVVSVQGGYRLTNRWQVLPGFWFMQQKKAREWVVQSWFSYDLNGEGFWEETRMIVGLSGRIQDAMVPTAGLQWRSWQALLSYDVNVSRLKNASRSRGALEISLIHQGQRPRNSGPTAVPCPRL